MKIPKPHSGKSLESSRWIYKFKKFVIGPKVLFSENQELLDQELKIKSSIAVLVQKLTQKPAEQEEKEIREKLFVLNNEYTSFVKKLEKDFPKYFNLKFSQRINTVSDIQNQLDATTGLISYFLAEKTNRLYQFSVTKQRFKIKDSSIPPDLNRLLKGFMNSILFSNFETYKKTSLPIAALLKPNVDRQIKELVVIPTGRLGTIPFDALPSGRIKGTNFNQVSYWLKEYAISYEFASNLFTQKGREKLATESPTIFLCAPVTFPEKDNLSQLPGTEKEVNNISQLFDLVEVNEEDEQLLKDLINQHKDDDASSAKSDARQKLVDLEKLIRKTSASRSLSII